MPNVIRSYYWLFLLILLVHLRAPGWCASAQDNSGRQKESTEQILDRIQHEVEAESVSDSSYDQLGAILEKDPSNYRAHLLLAGAYELLGLPQEAYEQSQLALKYGPHNSKAIVGMIKAEMKSGRVALAAKLIDDGLKDFPSDPDIMFWKGNFLYSQNKLKEADEMYERALESKSNIAGLATALGVIRFGQKRYMEAYALAKQDLNRNPNAVLASQVAGLSLMKLHAYDRAVQPLGVAFRATPMKSIIAEEYAQALYWKGDYVEALRPALINLASSASLYTNDAFAKNVLGRILRHVNRHDLAGVLTEMNGKLSLDKNPAYHFSLGDVLDKYGFRDLAMEQYKQGLTIEPSFGRGWYRLGLDYEKQTHDYAEALSCLQKAVSLLPEDESISKHLMRLEDRYSIYKKDWAWQIREMLHRNGWLT